VQDPSICDHVSSVRCVNGFLGNLHYTSPIRAPPKAHTTHPPLEITPGIAALLGVVVAAGALVVLELLELEGVDVEGLDLVDNGGVVAVMLVGPMLIRDPGKEVVGGTGAVVGGKYLENSKKYMCQGKRDIESCMNLPRNPARMRYRVNGRLRIRGA
jgi:hypothetical protein